MVGQPAGARRWWRPRHFDRLPAQVYGPSCRNPLDKNRNARHFTAMSKMPLAGWSLIVAVCALAVSIGAVSYTRKLYNLAYEQDLRAIALKKPTLDLFPESVDERHWKLKVTLGNRSDQRILPTAMSIPSPDGGFVTINQTEPSGAPVSGVQMNSRAGMEFLRGRPIAPGEIGVWTGTYEISGAFPAAPGTALTMNMIIKFLGSSEKTETLSTTRQLN
jgi:hypothetical protein